MVAATEADINQLTGEIADTLGETDQNPRDLITAILGTLGPDTMLSLVREAQRIDVEGGMLTDDGSRRRTLGGIFFKLAKNTLTPKDRYRIFAPARDRVTVRRVPQFPPGRRVSADTTAEVQAVNLTLTGRPTKVEDRTTYLLATLQDSTVPVVPVGVPAPSTEPTTYMVVLSRKQWQRVETQLTDRVMALHIDGTPKRDARYGTGIVVYAHAVRCVPATEGVE